MTSVARRRDPDDLGEYSDTSQDIEQNNFGNEGGQHESDYDSQGSDSERSDGDPEKQQTSSNTSSCTQPESGQIPLDRLNVNSHTPQYTQYTHSMVPQETERRVDDDEDRSNPQYIPKRGTFYEHDDRTADGGEEPTNPTSEPASEKKEGSETSGDRRRPPRKSESLNKWSHDKYNENEQVPKSRDELVAIYGYDIRNEDAPPHARRNRRYGRGPNKYTRTWEDEEAYKRQAAQTLHKKPPSPADFPELNAVNKPGRKPRPRQRSKSQPASNDSSENGSLLRRNVSIRTPNPKLKPIKPNAVKPGLKQGAPADRSKDKIHIPMENLTITTTVNNNNQGHPQRKINAAVAQQRPVPTEQNKKKPLISQPPLQSNNTAKQPAQQQRPSTQQQQQQATAGGESRGGGSKRYSSLRQRPLAETYTPQQQPPQTQKPPPQSQQPPPQSQQQPLQTQQQPPQAQQQPPQTQQPPQLPPTQQQQQQPPQQPPQQQPQPQQPHRYHGEFVGGSQPPQHQGSPGPQNMHPQQILHPVHRNAVTQPQHGPSPPHQTIQQPQHTQQQVRLGILDQQQIVQHPHHTMHNIPQPHAIGQIQPAPQGYAPPAMLPTQYMQQSGSGGVFGATPIYQPPAAYPHQLYQHHNYGTHAGGVTYYSCAEQELPPRQPRRPTAAIPIVRPAHSERPVNSSEKDNIDRIVENMFVRKPWPAHGADAPKDKAQDSRNSQEPQSKEPSQPNSLTSSSISTDSKPERTEKTEKTESENPDSTEA